MPLIQRSGQICAASLQIFANRMPSPVTPHVFIICLKNGCVPGHALRPIQTVIKPKTAARKIICVPRFLEFNYHKNFSAFRSNKSLDNFIKCLFPEHIPLCMKRSSRTDTLICCFRQHIIKSHEILLSVMDITF